MSLTFHFPDLTPARCAGVLDSNQIAHFELPEEIRIEIVEADRRPWAGPSVPVLLRRGYSLPPLKTDDRGRLRVTKEAFQRAETDEVSTGLMDHRGDYSLVRYVEVSVPSTEQELAMATARRNSGWPILAFEKVIYGSLDRLLAAYVPPAAGRVMPTHAVVDLARNDKEVDLVLNVCRE